MSPVHVHHFSAAATDKGFVRPENEDRVYCDDVRGFFLVVDGIGGHEAGEQAAEITVERIRTRLERQTDTIEQRLREAIALANNAIFESAQERPEWEGMSCVLTIAVVENGRVTVGHVGDSRLYKLKRQFVEKITRDHSPVGEREDRGELTEAEAMRHPRRNEVYRDVGSEEHRPDDEGFIEIFTFELEPDSAFLLCSDGLSDAISSRRILEIVEQNAGDRWSTVRALIAAATEFGTDNVSAVLIEGQDFAASFGRRSVDTRESGALSHLSAAEETGQLPVLTTEPGARSRPRYYRSPPAYLLYGALFGAAAGFSAHLFLAQRTVAKLPKVLAVSAPGTISDALAKASPGDVVHVASGIYTEAVRLREGVALVAQPPQRVIIQGTVSAQGLSDARIEGFQIRGAEFGVRINNSHVVLVRDDIAESRGAGVEFSGDARGSMFACDIHNNAGPGIVLSDTAAPVIENSAIFENGLRPSSLLPGILVRSTLHVLIARNIIAGNGAEAIWLPAPDENLAEQNSFAFAGKSDGRPNFRIVSLQKGRP